MPCSPDYRPLPRGIRNITGESPERPMRAFFSVKARNIKLVILNDRFAKVEETRVGTGIAVRS